MKIDDVLKAHKLCWTPGEALDDPVCCDGCPYKQYGDACARHLIADTIEVLEECKNINEYDIYRKHQLECLTEDAHNFVRDYLADKRDVDPDDIEDEELEKYDYEYLVTRYEKLEDCNIAFNDTWQYVVEDYMSDFDDENEDEEEEG